MGRDVQRDFGKKTRRTVSPGTLIHNRRIRHEYHVRRQNLNRDTKGWNGFNRLDLRGLQGNGTMRAIGCFRRMFGGFSFGCTTRMCLGGRHTSLGDMTHTTAEDRCYGEHRSQGNNQH